ncbi:MAG TPA: alpha/beta hydrolase [Solirubrobacter sp.]
MTLDIETKALLDELAGGEGELTVDGARAFGVAMARRFGTGPEMDRVERHTVDGLEMRVLVPQVAPRALVVFFHGGGWVCGSLDEVEALGRTLAERTTCAVVLAQYRLAPEHPFPAAVDDAWTALRWAAQYAAGLPLMVAGDSAGANLAAVVAQRSVHDGPALALQILVEPVTDVDTETASYRDPDNQLIVTRESMRWFLEHYAPEAESRRDPRLAPLRAASLAGAPPAVVLTAEHDVLRDEGEAYAERLRAAGVDVSHQRFEGQMHGFFGQLGVLPGSAAGIDYVVAAIDRYCAV